jgi:ABC-type amino acid transport system permease subunit
VSGSTGLGTAIQGTIALWALSAGLAVAAGLSLAAGSASRRAVVRLAARAAVNVSRGIPTPVLVLAAGVGLLGLAGTGGTPGVFPGTAAGFQPLAWGIVAALAMGSAGHLAEIFRAARSTLGPARLEQAAVLALAWPRRLRLVVREAAPAALPPASARLIHHLHNTGFASLFPVTELFGFVQGRANATFEVWEYVALGAALYVALSAGIWGASRALESALLHRTRREPPREPVAVEVPP